jgi:hypothetical protein
VQQLAQTKSVSEPEDNRVIAINSGDSCVNIDGVIDLYFKHNTMQQHKQMQIKVTDSIRLSR